MADEADPDNVLAVKTSVPGRLIALAYVGLSGNLEVLNMVCIISVNPNILGGTPVFAGTRVPIESLYEYLIRGKSIDYFLEQFPTVQRDQIETLLDEAKANSLSRHAPA